MSLPKVSILVPVYNAGPFLAECLESILGQDFGDYELLICDDGSTDGSLALIKHYAARDPRIRWWQNPRNLGLTRNHNLCLREARGEFIKFVHQDDKLLQSSELSRMLEILEQDATVALVGTGSQLIDAQARVLTVRNNFHQTGTWDGKAVIVKCLEQNQNLIGEPTAVMFRKSQAGRGFDERYRQIVDMELWFHLLEQGRFAYLAESFFAHRIHPQQATEMHKRTGVSVDDHRLLFTDYYRKPWLREYATRRMWFKQIYYLRKKYGPRAQTLAAEAMTRLKPFWYAVYWLEHKFARPFVKLKERLLRRLTKS
ncbi:MAG TPA: glycosyl transferase family 2 [Verrucomicrobia subdivision 3 bacterium]|nr:glycosyl transferase family 2 [Limisphaerales bacterium]